MALDTELLVHRRAALPLEPKLRRAPVEPIVEVRLIAAVRVSISTVDLVFGLTVGSSRTAELFNLMGSVATFLNRNR